MTDQIVRELVIAGRLERVPPDLPSARALLSEAERHLQSAAAIAEADANGAYALLYDAARKAVTARLLAEGLRVTNRPGAHATVVRYAQRLLQDGPGAEHVQHFDRMRRDRNKSEYEVRVFGSAQVASDLAHAHGIVDAVRHPLIELLRSP